MSRRSQRLASERQPNCDHYRRVFVDESRYQSGIVRRGRRWSDRLIQIAANHAVRIHSSARFLMCHRQPAQVPLIMTSTFEGARNNLNSYVVRGGRIRLEDHSQSLCKTQNDNFWAASPWLFWFLRDILWNIVWCWINAPCTSTNMQEGPASPDGKQRCFSAIVIHFWLIFTCFWSLFHQNLDVECQEELMGAFIQAGVFIQHYTIYTPPFPSVEVRKTDLAQDMKSLKWMSAIHRHCQLIHVRFMF